MKKILIVDDAPFIIEVLRSIIDACDEAVVVGEACDGVDAVRKCSELKPDVIIMDLVMPEKSGIQATKEILARQPGVRIIACTTVDQEIMMMKAMEAGCVGYLNKPFKKEDVLSVISGGSNG